MCGRRIQQAVVAAGVVQQEEDSLVVGLAKGLQRQPQSRAMRNGCRVCGGTSCIIASLSPLALSSRNRCGSWTLRWRTGRPPSSTTWSTAPPQTHPVRSMCTHWTAHGACLCVRCVERGRQGFTTRSWLGWCCHLVWLLIGHQHNSHPRTLKNAPALPLRFRLLPLITLPCASSPHTNTHTAQAARGGV